MSPVSAAPTSAPGTRRASCRGRPPARRGRAASPAHRRLRQPPANPSPHIVSVRDFPQEHLRRLLILVPQDVYLFNVSLRDNIRLAGPDASDAQVETAARAALADEFIAGLPDGYDTVAGELGARLSGGQRQRIAITRAFLKDAPILVLDEAVFNLDAASEAGVAAAMAAARAGRTTLVIAHRLSTIRAADRVVVLQDGGVAETGTHEQLLAGD
ncbi:MAG: ATP-binding cassette domain-containing protein [Euzebyales bacterium]|nr:ATP-binding cassette domain-containing protein [Euzebyales bacterium]